LVATGARDLEELARTVALNTVDQAQSVSEGRALTEQVAQLAQISAERVQAANRTLQEVRDTVALGQTAIASLTEGIEVLQTGSAQIVQRMKALGEFVGLAEQFVLDQSQIASLTQVLAINATLVAARASEQRDPKQFIGVAREFEAIAGQVNDLANQTNAGLTVLRQRTGQIQTVVSAIDAEVQNLGGLVAGFTSGVESSRAAFRNVQTLANEVVLVGQDVTESSMEIASSADATAKYMSEIAQLAAQTADLTRNARQQSERMGNIAERLLASIQFFRLPASDMSGDWQRAIAPNLDRELDDEDDFSDTFGSEFRKAADLDDSERSALEAIPDRTAAT
jgi:twitching motility protein PilJ